MKIEHAFDVANRKRKGEELSVKQDILRKLRFAKNYISTEPDKCLIYLENAMRDIKNKM